MTSKETLRPISVRVGHIDYTIEWVDETKWLKDCDPGKSGLSWYGTGSIQIRLQANGHDMHEDVLREVLLHEIVHTCWNAANMANSRSEKKMDVEEWFVGSITMPMIQVLRDNPDVVAYLTKP